MNIELTVAEVHTIWEVLGKYKAYKDYYYSEDEQIVMERLVNELVEKLEKIINPNFQK